MTELTGFPQHLAEPSLKPSFDSLPVVRTVVGLEDFALVADALTYGLGDSAKATRAWALRIQSTITRTIDCKLAQVNRFTPAFFAAFCKSASRVARDAPDLNASSR
jgi:hypothetical protein